MVWCVSRASPKPWHTKASSNLVRLSRIKTWACSANTVPQRMQSVTRLTLAALSAAAAGPQPSQPRTLAAGDV